MSCPFHGEDGGLNALSVFNAYSDVLLSGELSPGASMLFVSLFAKWNKCRRPEVFSMRPKELMRLGRIPTKDAYYSRLKELLKSGLINYQKGNKSKSPLWSMNASLGLECPDWNQTNKLPKHQPINQPIKTPISNLNPETLTKYKEEKREGTSPTKISQEQFLQIAAGIEVDEDFARKIYRQCTDQDWLDSSEDPIIAPARYLKEAWEQEQQRRRPKLSEPWQIEKNAEISIGVIEKKLQPLRDRMKRLKRLLTDLTQCSHHPSIKERYGKGKTGSDYEEHIAKMRESTEFDIEEVRLDIQALKAEKQRIERERDERILKAA